MQLPNVGRLVGLGKALVMANRPEILLGTSIAAGLGSTVLAAKGGYDSGKLVALTDVEREQQGEEPLTLQEKTALTWKNYIPAAGVYLTGLASTVGLHWVHVKEKKALVATGLAAVEEVRTNAKAYVDDIQKSVEENATPKTLEKIEESVASKQLERMEMWSDGILEPQYVIRDRQTGRDKWGNRQDVMEAVTELNRTIVDNGEADLNTFYSHLGLNHIDDGDSLGWGGGQRVTVRWSLGTRDDGTPLQQFQLEPAPKADFDRPNR